MTSFDAILVGGGHNALACAAHLAQRGWKVGVFERNAVCGGAVRTEELTLPGYRHDLGAMNLNLFAGSAFHRAYQEKLTVAGLDFAPAKDCFASVFPNDKWFGVSSDLDRNLSRLANLSHRDAEQWRWLAERFVKDSGPLLRLLGSPMTACGLTATAWAIWRAKGVRGSLEMLRFLLSSSREWLDQTFESPEVRATMLPKIIEGDEAGTIDSRDWRLAKEAYADRVVSIIEKHAPGFTESIKARAVFSPLDLQAMNVNLVGGDGLGGSHHLAQNFLFRPAAGRANGSTPFRNLHLVGASVWPGAGVGAGSGFLLAQKLAGK